VAHGLKPLEGGTFAHDPDSDSWSNLEECYGGGDPRNADSVPTPVVTVLDVPVDTALVVGGSILSVLGVFLHAGCSVSVGEALCADGAVSSVGGLSTLTAVAPPGSEGTADLVVEDPVSDTADLWPDAITYTADPFDTGLDTTPRVVRAWHDGAGTTLYAYVPSWGQVTMTTPQGTDIVLPAALRSGYQACFILIRDAATLSGLPLDQTPTVPDGFSPATPAFDIGGLVSDGTRALEIDEPFAEPVTATFPVASGAADDPLRLGFIETHLGSDLSPCCAVAPGEGALLSVGSEPIGSDPAANTVTFEFDDFTTYVGLAPVVYEAADVNRDGIVDAVDVQLVFNAVLGMAVDWDCDVNGDGVVDAVDVQTITNVMLKVELP
jgi:hypothetical protein